MKEEYITVREIRHLVHCLHNAGRLTDSELDTCIGFFWERTIAVQLRLFGFPVEYNSTLKHYTLSVAYLNKKEDVLPTGLNSIW